MENQFDHLSTPQKDLHSPSKESAQEMHKIVYLETKGRNWNCMLTADKLYLFAYLVSLHPIKVGGSKGNSVEEISPQ